MNDIKFKICDISSPHKITKSCTVTINAQDTENTEFFIHVNSDILSDRVTLRDIIMERYTEIINYNIRSNTTRVTIGEII